MAAFSMLSAEEFIDGVGRICRAVDAVTAALQGAVAPVRDYMVKSEAADYLRVSERTIERWMDEGRVAFVKFGDEAVSGVRFRRTDLDAFMQAGAVTLSVTAARRVASDVVTFPQRGARR